MNMNDKILKEQMNALYNNLKNSHTDKDLKIIIGKAVSLGMKYQEEKIKSGIDIVFDELHKKNI